MKLLLGTGNAGKIREITGFLKILPVEIVSLRDFKDIQPETETGNSFLANARSKAESYSRQTGLLTLAEDSGLQVDFLNGQPGCHSARYAGEGASDKENVQKLLREMRKAGRALRSARFVCVVALTDGRRMWIETGKCEGRIASRPIGDSGFGYDPIFIPNGFPTTFARLGEDVKNQISHRAHALQKVCRILEALLSDLTGKV